MSRCMTLEEYLQRFVDENTQSAREDVTLAVTDEQAHTLGFFLINGLAGFVECVRLEREPSQTSDEDGPEALLEDESNEDDFIN